MRYPLSLFSVLLIAWTALPAVAQGQMFCGDREKAIASLEKEYSEKPVSMGLASNGAVIEVFASESGSFTIIMTHPNGVSCMIAAGENWENLPEKLAGDET